MQCTSTSTLEYIVGCEPDILFVNGEAKKILVNKLGWSSNQVKHSFIKI